MDLLWKSIILIFTGIVFLRITGRKSISQMTIGQTVIMISIGTLIVQPIADKSIWRAILAVIIFAVFNIILEYLELKFNPIEKLITGQAKEVIKNGQLLPQNMKKLRITVDQLEMRLRQQGIKNISDVKTATLEANGQLGYELGEDAQPLTVGQFKQMMGGFIQNVNTQQSQSGNLFTEITDGGHQNDISDQLH